MSDAPPPSAPDTVIRGLLLLAGWHLLQIPGLVIFAPAWIALSQMVYVIPLSISLGRQGRPLAQKGLWIGAAVTALLNATCWGALAVGNSRVFGPH